jgi:hypothetical protein
VTRTAAFRDVDEAIGFCRDALGHRDRWGGSAAKLSATPRGPIIRIHPKRIISFGIDETDTPAHGLTVNARDIG